MPPKKKARTVKKKKTARVAPANNVASSPGIAAGNVDQIVGVDQMLKGFLNSMADASQQIQERFVNSDLPYLYHIPEMNLKINVALTYEEGQMKGWFVNKKKSNEARETSSTIDIKIVAIPNQNALKGTE